MATGRNGGVGLFFHLIRSCCDKDLVAQVTVRSARVRSTWFSVGFPRRHRCQCPIAEAGLQGGGGNREAGSRQEVPCTLVLYF